MKPIAVMRTVQYQRWNPPQSPVRIEFPPQLPADLARESCSETRGSLYGLLLGGEIRVHSAKADTSVPPDRSRNAGNPPPASEKVGLFVYHPDGEVFLSESDLERFESQRAAVALVIAGDRAGFFVRQADGSIQSIRSHEEFPLISSEPPEEAAEMTEEPAHADPSGPNLKPTPPRPPVQPARRKESKPAHWPRAAVVFLAIPLAGLAYLKPLSPAPVHLRLAPAGSVVSISWNAPALPRGGVLEILDGSDSVKVDIGPRQSSLSYAPRSGRLEVQMTIDSGTGPEVLDSAMLAMQPLPSSQPPPNTGALDQQIATLESEAGQLHESLDSGRARIALLQKALNQLTRR